MDSKCILSVNQTGFEDGNNRYGEGCGFFFRNVNCQLPFKCLLIDEVSHSWAYTSRTKDRRQHLYMIIRLGVIGTCVVFKAMGLAEIIKGDNAAKEEAQE